MKRSLLRILPVVVLGALCIASASAQGGYNTLSWHTQADIHQDRSVAIRETIEVNFYEPRHGIIRKIPIRTQGDGGVRFVHLNVQDVEWDRGGGMKPVQFSQQSDGDLSLKIGDPSQTITGHTVFRIDYDVDGALTDLKSPTDHTEFYWNLIPAHWATPIDKASFTVNSPAKPERVRVYVGEPGSKANWDSETGGSNAGVRPNLHGQTFDAVATRRLDSGEGMTVVLGLPPGSVAPPPAGTVNGAYMEPQNSMPWDPLGFLLPLAAPVLYILALNKRIGIHRSKVQVAFEPPAQMSLLDTAIVLSNEVKTRDFLACVVSLAQRKIFQLVHDDSETPTPINTLGQTPGASALKRLEQAIAPKGSSFNIEFLPVKNGADGQMVDWLGQPLLESETALYESLLPFSPSVSPSDLRGNFGSQFATIQYRAKAVVAKQGYLYGSGLNSGMGCLLIVALFLMSIGLAPSFGPPIVIGSVGAFVAMLVLMGLTKRLTDPGLAVKDQLLGLKEFITRSHQRELNYFAHTDFNQALYDKLLPFAIQFNAVREWTQAFQGIDLTPPDWYVGYNPNVFWYDQFYSDYDTFNSTFVPTVPTTSYGSGSDWSSGGSGFDGGGGSDFGGGGGGGDSW